MAKFQNNCFLFQNFLHSYLMTSHTFIVKLPPDPETDFPGGIAIATFEDPYDYDEDMIMATKESLAHQYMQPVDQVYTGEEYANIYLSGGRIGYNH